MVIGSVDESSHIITFSYCQSKFFDHDCFGLMGHSWYILESFLPSSFNPEHKAKHYAFHFKKLMCHRYIRIWFHFDPKESLYSKDDIGDCQFFLFLLKLLVFDHFQPNL